MAKKTPRASSGRYVSRLTSGALAVGALPRVGQTIHDMIPFAGQGTALIDACTVALIAARRTRDAPW